MCGIFYGKWVERVRAFISIQPNFDPPWYKPNLPSISRANTLARSRRVLQCILTFQTFNLVTALPIPFLRAFFVLGLCPLLKNYHVLSFSCLGDILYPRLFADAGGHPSVLSRRRKLNCFSSALSSMSYNFVFCLFRPQNFRAYTTQRNIHEEFIKIV